MTGIGPRLTPYHWWGDAFAKSNRLTLVELVELGMVTRPNAESLVNQVRSGGSIIVGSGKSGSGKSTLANALIACVPATRTAAFVRGNHESLAWCDDFSPTSLTLLVNEISEHLPVYAWGGTAKRLLQLSSSGAQLITTMHVNSDQTLTSVLRSHPIAAGLNEIQSLGILVLLDEFRTLESGLAPITGMVDLQTGLLLRTA